MTYSLYDTWVATADELAAPRMKDADYRRNLAASLKSLQHGFTAAQTQRSFAPLDAALRDDFTFTFSTTSYFKGYGMVASEAAKVNALWLMADMAPRDDLRRAFVPRVLEATGTALKSWEPTASELDQHLRNNLSSGAHSYFTFVQHIAPAIERMRDPADAIFTGVNGAEHALATSAARIIRPDGTRARAIMLEAPKVA